MKDIVRQNGDSDNFLIRSAATSRDEIGSDTHYGTKNILKRYGVPFEPREAVQMTKDDYDKYDYIIGMDKANISNILKICGDDPKNKVSLLLTFAGIDRSIADPWYTGNFESTFEDVVLGCEELYKDLR